MNMWDRYDRDSKIISEYNSKLNKNNYEKILNELYDFIKSVTLQYYKNGEMVSQYGILKADLLNCEKKVKNIKLLDVPVKLNELDKDNFIEYLVLTTRQLFLKENNLTKGLKVNQSTLQNLNLTNYCEKASKFIKFTCDDKGIKSYRLSIYPGYNRKAMLYEGNGFHYFNIVMYHNEYYLIDTTYSQFFYANRNNLNRLGIVGTGGCNAGIFMLMTNAGKKIAKSLITNGYIKLDKDVLKTYLDAFTISFRNGLYYENTKDFSFTTKYSIDDYIKFLKGLDNQVNHENIKYLGFQRKPLKDYKINFKKR